MASVALQLARSAKHAVSSIPRRSKDLTDADLEKIRDLESQFTLEGDLRRETTMNIKRLMDIGCYHRFPSSSWPAHAVNVPAQTPVLARVRAKGCCGSEEIRD